MPFGWVRSPPGLGMQNTITLTFPWMRYKPCMEVGRWKWSLPRLRGHLLCFRTTLWGGSQGYDIALMDLDTWVVRRVTTTPHPGYECGHADSGWLVYRKQVGGLWHRDTIFAVNLVAAGILDASGHVIPAP